MRVTCLLTIVILGAVLSGIAADLHVPKDFATVQEAVDAASSGDRIVISSGVYHESLRINRAIQLVGEKDGSVIISGASSRQDVIYIDVDEGEVTLENLTIVGGTESAGIHIEVSDRARAMVTSTVVTGNRWGITCFGDGQVVLRNNYIVDNFDIGLQLGVAVARVSGNQVYKGYTGILLLMGRQAEFIDNVVALCSYGFVVCTNECPLWGTGTFKGVILGQRNKVFGYVCPAYRNWNWPERFFVDGYETFIRRFLTMLSEATDLVRQQQYDAASRIISDIEAQLQEAASPVPKLMRAEIHAVTAFLDARTDRSLQAVERVKETISLYEALGMWIQAVRMHNTLGILLRRLGQYRAAVHTYSEALQTLQIVPNHPNAEYLQKVTLHNLGVTYLFAGHYEEALRCFETADLPFLSQINAAVVLQTLGDYEQSVKMYLEAIASLRRPATLKLMEVAFSPIVLEVENYVPGGRGLVSSDQFVQLAIAYTNFAITLTEQGLYEEALPYFQRAAHVFETLGLWERCIDVYINMGACQIESGDLIGAEECYEQAQELLAKRVTRDPLRAAIIANDVGEIHRHRGEYEAALAQYAQALEMISPVDVPELEWRLHFNVGMCYELSGNFALAQDHYQQAVNIFECIRGHIRTEELKLAWGERTQHVYERLIDLMYRMDQGASAFPYTERCRARTFLDVLYQGGAKPEQFIGPEEGVVAGVVDPQAIDAAIQSALSFLGPGEAVFSYFVTEQGVYLWVITEDGVSEPLFIPYPREKLMQDIHSARVCIEEQENQLMVEEKLAPFYERLVQPGLARLGPGVKTLVIIPSGPLWYLPFAALPMTDRPGIPIGLAQRSTYLVEEYTLAYLPSLASLAALWERGETAEAPFLGLANPVTEAGVVEAQRFVELERATLAFAQAYAGEKGEVYSGEDAKEAVAYHKARGHRVVVYACHGQFNPYVPLQSKLLLAPGDGVEWEEGDLRVPDGDYHAWEALLTDHQGTELVVLAACETLLPAFRHLRSTQAEPAPEQLEEITTGDEVVGLVRAFLSTGAQSVLATLWQTRAQAVENLLVDVAERRLQGASWAEALALAQRELLATAAFAHPWLWAPYQLVGRWPRNR